MNSYFISQSLYEGDGGKKNLMPMFIFFLAVNIALLLRLSLFKEFNVDEFEHLHAAWNASVGSVPFKDFFQHHNVLFIYFLEPLFWFVDESSFILVVARCLMFSVSLGILYMSYIIARRLLGFEAALFSLILLTSFNIFINPFLEIRPDVLQTFFGLVSFYFLLVWIEDRKDGQMVLCGFFYSVSFFFLQKALFFLPVLFLIFLFYTDKDKWILKVSKGILFFITGCVPSLIVLFSYLLLHDNIKEYFVMNYLINSQQLGNFAQNLEAYSVFTTSVMDQNYIVWGMAFIGTCLLFFKKGREKVLLLAPIIILLLTIRLLKNPWRQYYMQVAPFICMAATLVLYPILVQLIHDFKPVTKKVFTFIFFFILLAQPIYDNYLNELSATNVGQLEKTQFVLDNSKKEDLFFSLRRSYNIYRKNIVFNWYDIGYSKSLFSRLGMKTYSKDPSSLIINSKPKII
ncbi:MAG: glycosyltransferase family 39 protein, partial [Nitrospinae bacterium]|nr:glycosyltransferase family 39 protein [Nitrospinota bacterium]